jgi:DNA-binding transcriptional LysR family regulator
MKACAIRAKGIVQLHDYMVKEEVSAGKLIEILPQYLNKQTPLYAYYNKYRFVQPKVRNFLEEYFDLMKN